MVNWQPENITQDTLQKYLTTKDFPDPELMIRTSGEYRISNFLLYQLAYSELYFTPYALARFQKGKPVYCHPRFSKQGTTIW